MYSTTDIIFRCDGNPSIGSGHIMRCLSIAEAAKKAGYRGMFVTADAIFTDIIKNKGHDNIILNSDYQTMDQELSVFLPAIQAYHPRVLFVDSYYVTPQYLDRLYAAVHAIGCKLIYIDDVLAFGYRCDLLLNYNIYGSDKKEEYEKLYNTCSLPLPSMLLSSVYAPLRSEFQDLPPRNIHRNAKNILISTGGSDAEHMGLGLLKAIIQERENLYAYYFHFVIGRMNEDAEKMRSLAESVSNITLHINVADMCSLMREMDVAISAAGSTLYELCATQTPTVTYVLADNQIPGAEGFSRHGIMENAGDVRDSSPLKLSERLLDKAVKLATDYDRRALAAADMRRIVDGNGAKRVIKEVF